MHRSTPHTNKIPNPLYKYSKAPGKSYLSNLLATSYLRRLVIRSDFIGHRDTTCIVSGTPILRPDLL
jgi:hypothetical protein